MEKKIKFTDKPTLAKIIYAAVIAALCIAAIVIGIVAANNRKAPNTPLDDTNIGGNEGGEGGNSGGNDDGGGGTAGGDNSGGNGGGEVKPTPDEGKLTFISPVVGTVTTGHSLTAPVFSETLEVWKVHTGIDVSTEEGADVFAAGDGEVTKVYSHPLLGFTVVIKHSDTVSSTYSNLDANSSAVPKVGDKVKRGEKIGNVGDSSLSELADEAHLHFEVLVSDAPVNPLDYISEEAKKASLGIESEGGSAA